MRALEIIRSEGFVAIIRSTDSESALQIGTSLMTAGVKALEVSLVTPGALEAIEELARRASTGVVIGAGTALVPEHVEAAASVGASFIVAPTTSRVVIESATALGLVSLPGAATPTEAVQAMRWGADMVKIFPASLWTPAALRDLLAALPDLPAVPTGGVTTATAAEWMRAGAVAVGVGSVLSSAPDIGEAVGELRSSIAQGITPHHV